MLNYLVKIKGSTPLIMHNSAGVDPQNTYTQLMKPLRAKRSKTEADENKLRDLSFLQSLYFNDELGLYMPTENLHKMLLEAGRHLDSKGAKKSVVGVGFNEYLGYPIVTKNSKDLNVLANDQTLRYVRICQVQKMKIVCVRAIFRDWKLSFELEIDESIINPKTVLEWIEYAGKRIGLGGRRPYAPTPGSFGKFIVEDFQLVKN